MRIRDMVRRRWLVLALGALLTAGALLAAASGDSVYWSRSQLIFLAPSSTAFPNSLETQSEALVVTAGLVAVLVNGQTEPHKYASSDVTLVGAPDGLDYWLRLPDQGGQWSTDFSQQVLLLDVVGPTVEAVEARHDEIVAEARETLDALQTRQGARAQDRITVNIAPAQTPVARIDGSRVRAMGMTAVLGIGITVGAVVLVDRVQQRRRREPLEGPLRTRVPVAR